MSRKKGQSLGFAEGTAQKWKEGKNTSKGSSKQ